MYGRLHTPGRFRPREEDCGCSAPRVRRFARMPRLREERTAAKGGPRDPVILSGRGRQGTTCRPFLVVEKDAERFAACNALADEIGSFDDPKKVAEFLAEAIGDELNEVFGVMTLDIHKRFKGMGNTGRGESSSVMAPIQSTLRTAIASGGDYAIIYHVHPSGIEAEPSDADIETTEAFINAFHSIDMPLLDHVIMGGDSRKRSYYSFLEDDAI